MLFRDIYKILIVAEPQGANTRFPCFANEIQGVYPEEVDGRTKLYTYVVKSQ